jgi:hypothetical protein
MNVKENLSSSETISNQQSYESIRYIIQRFEVNDVNNPSYYIIGFKLMSDLNQQEYYVETQIDYQQCFGKLDNEICLLAYNILKPKFDVLKEQIVKKKFIVGSEFVPPK